MKKLLLFGLLLAGCAGGGNTPPILFEFAGEFDGAAYFCPVHAGDGHFTIFDNGTISGTAYSGACTNVTYVVAGAVSPTGDFVGTLQQGINPTIAVNGNLSLIGDGLSGHWDMVGNPHGIDLSMKKAD